MTRFHRAAIAVLAVALLPNCTHAHPDTAAVRPQSPAAIQADDDTKAARRFILDHLETEVLMYQVKVDKLQLITPAYDGEYVFAANTTTTRGPGGPVLAWERVIGCATLKPKAKFYIWKERAIAPLPPSPPTDRAKVESSGLPGEAQQMQNEASNSR